LRRIVKQKPNADVYEFRRENLSDLERLSEQGKIDLLYGDQSRVSLQPYIPYAWQFADEEIGLPSTSGGGQRNRRGGFLG